MATATSATSPLTASELELIDAYWRAANYLSVGQIYLMDNPLLWEPLLAEHVKPRLLGHWGTTPGLNLIYAHLNRVIRARDLNVVYLCGPGHGGPGLVANTYLEGTYSEIYPAITQDGDGLRRLFRQFSFPGGIPSHAAPETPGSIHEGGELGYVLAHAFGAAFDNPDLIVAAVVGDGEAETGPLATSWHCNKFLNPAQDGGGAAVLHLNGYKIANPTVLARIPEDELAQLLRGYGWEPHFVSGRRADIGASTPGRDPRRDSGSHFRHSGGRPQRAGRPSRVAHGRAPHPEGLDRTEKRRRPSNRRVLAVTSGPAGRHPDRSGSPRQLEEWLRSYRPEDLFDKTAACDPSWLRWRRKVNAAWELIPMPTAGCCSGICSSRTSASTPSRSTNPARPPARPPGCWAVPPRHHDRQCRKREFPGVRPGRDGVEPAGRPVRRDRTDLDGETRPDDDEHLSPDGRVTEVLSEHLCQGC